MSEAAKVVRFGPFELDVERAELRKDGVRLRMHDQPFRILAALLENPGITVSRKELVERIWPSGTFVDFEHSLNAAVNRLRRTLSDSVEHPLYIETVARHGYCFIGQAVPAASKSGDQDDKAVPAVETSERLGHDQALQTVAVLPFVNLGPDRSDDYFSDGLAEELISGLSKVPLLRVTARSSSALFRDRTFSLKEIAERLRVRYVLDGSFRRSGDRIRVAAQLVNGADESCLWAEQYDRDLGDLLDVQEGVARSIVDTLKLGPSRQRLIRRYTRNEDAHLFYLKGGFYLHKWDPDSMERLADYMRRVVALEPAFAPAWVELAHIALGQVMTGCIPPTSVMADGMEAAYRAVSADRDLAEAHGVLGLLEGIYEYKWVEALSEFRMALRLNPSSPGVRYFHAMVLIGLGRIEEAISELHRSLEVDPFSVLANQHLCRLYTIRGDYLQAIAYGKRAVEVGPQHWPGAARLGQAYVYSGELEEGIRWMEQSRSIAPAERRFFTAGLAAAYCQAGRRIDAEDLLSEGERRSSEHYVPGTLLGLIAAELGYIDRAFEHFRRALQDRDCFLFLVRTERSLDPIRKEARYTELLRALNVSIP